MKKSFTLLEVVISITIFMIVLLFLYKVLDQTKLSNKLFESRQEKVNIVNNLNNIIIEDIAESIEDEKDKATNTFDKNNNSRYQFKTQNTYHNAFYKYITYMLSNENELLRIESLTKFRFENENYDFYDTAYIDVLLEDIEYFEVSNNSFILKQKDKKQIIVRAFKLN